MATNLGLNMFRRSLLSNVPNARLVQPCLGLPQRMKLSVRVAYLSTNPRLYTHYPASNKLFILNFTRGLRGALERNPVRRIVRPSRPPFEGGDSGDFLQYWKRRINRMNPDHIFYAILGINGLVFLMWGWAQENWVNVSSTNDHEKY